MKAMQYEKTPIRPLAKSKGALKLTTDMTKLSTLNILRYLYRRHDTSVWIVLFWLSVAVAIFNKLG